MSRMSSTIFLLLAPSVFLATSCGDDSHFDDVDQRQVYEVPAGRAPFGIVASDEVVALRTKVETEGIAEIITVMDTEGEASQDLLQIPDTETTVDVAVHDGKVWVLARSAYYDPMTGDLAGYNSTLRRADPASGHVELFELNLVTMQYTYVNSEEVLLPVQYASCQLQWDGADPIVATEGHLWRIAENGEASLIFGDQQHWAPSLEHQQLLCTGIASEGRWVAFDEDGFAGDARDAAWTDVITLSTGEQTRHLHGLDTPWRWIDPAVIGPDGALYSLAMYDQNGDNRGGDYVHQLIRFDAETAGASWLDWIPAELWNPDTLLSAGGGLVIGSRLVSDGEPASDLAFLDSEGTHRFITRTRLASTANSLAGNSDSLFLLRSDDDTGVDRFAATYGITKIDLAD